MTDEVLDAAESGRPVGSRRAERSSRFPQLKLRGRGGARAQRTRRRAKGLGSTLGLTTLGAFVPGTGYLIAGRRWLGALVLLVWLGSIGGLVWYFGRGLENALDFALNPGLVRAATVAIVVALVVWAFIVFTSYRLLRPRERPRSHTVIGNALVALLVVVGAVPVVRAAQYALVTADGVEEVLPENVESATTPEGVTAEDPWAGQDRVNVLLLGGDGGEGREGIRTDTVILASIETKTGRTVMFSLPRNMMYAQFPEDSPLHDVYPDGYQTGQGDPGFDMLNAIYSQVPVLHPGILGDSDNEGADAVKQAVEGSLGVPVDYYLLVNLKGFQTVVDALGGITVNVNQPVAINGDTDRGIPPTGYIQPGPDQELDGFHALWFARGRWKSDDYQRMDRQRCTINAIIDAADPTTLLTRYIDIVKAGKEIVYTDVPRKIARDFVQLMLRVKDGKTRSVVFRPSENFSSSNPDFEWMQAAVQNALYPPPPKPGKPKVASAENPEVECAYDPVDPSTYDTSDSTGEDDPVESTDPDPDPDDVTTDAAG
ncbi:LCP family protein [Nocardioides sp. C4-1]|uniref:LCP family protein n=1 Tax=Nocardioides sp. C4-1 TaxID=3151851 RepID=UPI0032642AE0